MSDQKELLASLQSIDFQNVHTRADRVSLAIALRAAAARLQEPWEIAWDHGWETQATILAIRTFSKAGLWKKWIAAGRDVVTDIELGEIAGMDPVLVRELTLTLSAKDISDTRNSERLARHLTAKDLLRFAGENTYGLTEWAKAMATDEFESVYYYANEINAPALHHFPEFAAKTKFVNPSDFAYSNWTDWGVYGQNVFEGFKQNPAAGTAFNTLMAILSGSKTSWCDIYPTETIIAAQKADRVLVVDMGGGRGHDLQKMRNKHPDVPRGSYVLQDLPEVIKQTTVTSPAIATAHNFFEPQPIKGARIYYMHVVIHDWPDNEAIKILNNIAAAMEKGYSRLLLYETVIDPLEPRPRGSTMDLTMLASVSAAERSEPKWIDLATASGFRVSKIWRSAEAIESVIELELL